MSPVSESAFVSAVRRLSDAEFVAFVADLWAARGYETEVDERVVVATPEDGRSRRLVIRCFDGDGSRWGFSRGEGDIETADRRDVDIVVTRGENSRPRRVDGRRDVRWVDERELRRMALYAVDRQVAEALFRRYFGRRLRRSETERGEAVTDRSRLRSVGIALLALVTLCLAVALLSPGLPGVGPAIEGVERASSPEVAVTYAAPSAVTPPPTGGTTPAETGNPTGGETRAIAPSVPETGPQRFAGNATSAPSWPMFRATAGRTGVAHRTTGPRRAAGIISQLSGRTAASPPTESSPAFVAGNVFVGRGNGDRSNGIVSRVTLDPLERQWVVRIGSAVTSSPAVRGDSVYVGSATGAEAADRDALPDANLYALNATNGHVRWGFEMGSVDRSSPVVVNDTVYVGSTDHRVYAVWAANGSERWSRSTGGPVVSSPAVRDGTLYVGSSDGRLYAFDAETGRERWNASLTTRVVSTPAVANGSVFVGGEDGSVYALHVANGTVRWTAQTAGRVPASPAVRNGSVFVGSYDETLYAFDAESGDVEWQVSTGAPVFASAAVANDTVYAGDVNGTVYALDADGGDVLWTFTTGERMLASPVVADGRLVVATSDRLYVLGE